MRRRGRVVRHFTRRRRAIRCSVCNLRELCLAGGVAARDLPRVENVVCARRSVRRGQALFSAGDPFRSLYAVRRGVFKTTVLDGEGRELVTGFSFSGELLGLEGAGAGRHAATATALDDCVACVLPFRQIEDAARQIPALQRALHGVLAREIVRQHGWILQLGLRRAESRLAAFLLGLAARLRGGDAATRELHLHMTRGDIGSHVNLKLETVSRMLSHFQKAGLIAVRQRSIRLLDPEGLRQLSRPAAFDPG